MSDLTVGSWKIPTADLGPPSPLPPIRRRPMPAVAPSGEDLPPDMISAMAYGHADTLLPYAMQDAYTRTTSLREHPVAVLENQWLKAVFLLDLGGRLWSLTHKPSQSELLALTPSIIFGNLGLRNAWFRGGAEWNVATTGHSPLTCSPLHAARLDDGRGNPILRLYEWERMREVVIQVDVYLPDDSPVLLVRPRVFNPGTRPAPMYWWTNLAVPLTRGMRVITPARSAYVLGVQAKLRLRELPGPAEADLTFPGRWSHAADMFFMLPDEQLPWIAALSASGTGIFLASPPSLPGRKLWVWGDTPAGRNWQEFLGPGAGEYIEIQAGLTRTQFEHWPLAAGETRAWVEAYGRLSADSAIALGADWGAACRHTAERIGQQVTPEGLSEADRLLRSLADSPPDSILHRGEGWGALERRRRELRPEPGPGSPGVVFDDESLGEDQEPWLTLLETGEFPEAPPSLPPRAFLVGEAWEALLRSSLPHHRAPWNAWFHLGIMRRAAGDNHGAESAWAQSLQASWTPWAARNLSVLLWERGRRDEALSLILEAHRAAPDRLDLLIECGSMLIEAGRAREWMGLLASLTPRQRANGRLRLLEARAAALAGDLVCLERFFADRIVPDDLREGETSLADLWSVLQARGPVKRPSQTSGAGSVRPDLRPSPMPAEMDYVMR